MTPTPNHTIGITLCIELKTEKISLLRVDGTQNIERKSLSRQEE